MVLPTIQTTTTNNTNDNDTHITDDNSRISDNDSSSDESINDINTGYDIDTNSIYITKCVNLRHIKLKSCEYWEDSECIDFTKYEINKLIKCLIPDINNNTNNIEMLSFEDSRLNDFKLDRYISNKITQISSDIKKSLPNLRSIAMHNIDANDPIGIISKTICLNLINQIESLHIDEPYE